MAYKLSIGDCVEYKVTLSVVLPSGETQEHKFKLVGDRIESTALLTEIKQHELTTADWIVEHTRGWSGQRLVLDESGQPAAYSPDALRCLLGIHGATKVIFERYLDHLTAKDGAAKN